VVGVECSAPFGLASRGVPAGGHPHTYAAARHIAVRVPPNDGTDGSGPRAGWDVVWVTPTDPELTGRALIASMIDCWFPPNFVRAVREHLRSGQPLEQPQATTLLAASLSFTAAPASHARACNALLANQLIAIADGLYFERSEVWSDQGELLATAELFRRDEPEP
jgi:hypothetical protein